MYPVMLSLNGQRCLVVGGGSVALRKVEGLLVDGASVTVVDPKPVEKLSELAIQGKISLETRLYKSGEAVGYALVFAATDDREVNRQVYGDAKSADIFVNVADDPELCTFHLPARVRRGPFQLAIASAGEAPFAVRRMRQVLERKFGPEWGEWIDAASRFRNRVRELELSMQEQEKRFGLFFESTVDEKRLNARVPSEDEEMAWIGSDIEVEEEAGGVRGTDDSTSAPREPGLVSLVGAGPGDPGLLTLRGRQRLMSADAVVCDRLALTALPCDLPDTTEIRFVGKTAGNHPVPQEEINALMVRLANEGKRVVRLKGGDPYIFGRGGEEATVLRRAGIPFEVLPCVTAAVAVPTYAGIPVTFRNEVVRVTLVTAHEADKAGGPQVRWDLLATDPHAMLLGYMGVTSLKKVTDQLLSAGMDPKTPAALIERGTTSRQRVVTSTVEKFTADVKEAGLKPPALFAIGSTVQHRETLDWFGERPLLGQRMVITTNGSELEEDLELSGVEVIRVSAPITKAARMVMDALPLTGCILTSADDVDVIDSERDSPSWEESAIAWCLDLEAFERAMALGWQNVENLAEIRKPNETLPALIERRISANSK